jgi:hypothetical protein
MALFDDDGIPLHLTTVLILFLVPNMVLIVFTCFGAYLIIMSGRHPRFRHMAGRITNFFSRGALDRIITSILTQLGHENQGSCDQELSHERYGWKGSRITMHSVSAAMNGGRHDSDYILLIPLQLDMLLTVLIYKILHRDVYFETCQSYLTTYHNRPKKVVCWLKYTDKVISDLSINSSLNAYCLNQSITYINHDYNTVICVQYGLKLINTIDTVTSIIAWHQAIVFIITQSVVFAYWWQRKLRKLPAWFRLTGQKRQMIRLLFIYIPFVPYISVFVLIAPVYFILMERRRIDMTRHLLYACSKFVIANVAHIHLYTLSKWYSTTTLLDPERDLNVTRVNVTESSNCFSERRMSSALQTNGNISVLKERRNSLRVRNEVCEKEIMLDASNNV